MTIKLIIFTLSILHIDALHEQCFADVDFPYVYFSARTSYAASGKSQINTPENCTPIYVWALIRHGTRYPSKNFITSIKKLYNLRDAIIQNHKEKRGRLCSKDLSLLEQWNNNLTISQSNELTFQGIQDEISLVQRLKKKFPDLLTSSTKNSFKFGSSAVKRAKDSALVFSNELLNTNYTNTDGNNITENEYLLHIGKYTCPSYAQNIQNNSSTYKEVELFQQSDIMQTVLSDISIRLGFQDTLSFESVELMYQICAYENAWYLNSKPPFCAAFLPEQLKVFEYLDDMEFYYKIGYGNSFSEMIGCPVIQDMMRSLMKAANDSKQEEKATFYFSHSEMILPTTVKLGLNRDDQDLRHDNYEQLKESRKWKLALFDTFAANIITVLHECTSPEGMQHKIILYENEREVQLPMCTGNLCILTNLLQNFSDVFNESQCNLNFCRIPEAYKSKGNKNSFYTIIILIIISVWQGCQP